MCKTKNDIAELPKQKFLFDDPELHEKGCYWQWMPYCILYIDCINYLLDNCFQSVIFNDAWLYLIRYVLINVFLLITFYCAKINVELKKDLFKDTY